MTQNRESGHRDDDIQEELDKHQGKPGPAAGTPYPSTPEEDKGIQKTAAQKLADELGLEVDDNGNIIDSK